MALPTKGGIRTPATREKQTDIELLPLTAFGDFTGNMPWSTDWVQLGAYQNGSIQIRTKSAEGLKYKIEAANVPSEDDVVILKNQSDAVTAGDAYAWPDATKGLMSYVRVTIVAITAGSVGAVFHGAIQS